MIYYDEINHVMRQKQNKMKELIKKVEKENLRK